MSTTNIYLVKQDQEVERIGHTRNAFRSAMYVWDDIAKRYFNLEGFPFFDEDMQRRVWNAHNEKELTSAEILVLTSTMDCATIDKLGIDKVIEAFREYGAAHPNSSFLEQAEILGSASIREGWVIAWNQTSCSGDLWFEESADCGDDDADYLGNLSNAFDIVEQYNDTANNSD